MKIALFLPIMGLLVNVGEAANTPVYHGTYEVFDSAGNCSQGEIVGTIGNVRYQQVATGGGGSAITFVSPSDSEVRSYLLPTGAFDNTFKLVRATQLRFDFFPVQHDVFVRFRFQQPALIGPNTAEIRIIGEVNGFTSESCISVFRATLVRWLSF